MTRKPTQASGLDPEPTCVGSPQEGSSRLPPQAPPEGTSGVPPARPRLESDTLRLLSVRVASTRNPTTRHNPAPPGVKHTTHHRSQHTPPCHSQHTLSHPHTKVKTQKVISQKTRPLSLYNTPASLKPPASSSSRACNALGQPPSPSFRGKSEALAYPCPVITGGGGRRAKVAGRSHFRGGAPLCFLFVLFLFSSGFELVLGRPPLSPPGLGRGFSCAPCAMRHER